MAERPAGAPDFLSEPSRQSKGKWASFKLDDLAAIEKLIDKSAMYDPSSFTTRRRRAAHLKDYEYFCKEHLQLNTHAEMWDMNTIIDTQKKYIAGSAMMAKGIINEKVKVGSLYEIKYSFYWWNSHFVNTFSKIFFRWHTELLKFIHLVATHHELPSESWQKNVLTDAELSLMYQVVTQATTSVDNLQQHYNLWVLAWGTGARPGSLVLAEGYGRNDKKNDGTLRSTDATLRWSDVEFFRRNDQVCFRINLRYLKGHRDAYAVNYTEKSRSFLYLPDTSPLPILELDLTLTLLGQAIKRGLFPGGLAYVCETTDTWLKVDPVIAQQPVFVAANTAGSIDVNEPLKVAALNTRLRSTLIAAGLPQRNTMYCFRRERITATKHKYGTDAARDIAGHAGGSASHERYDSANTGDIDLQAYIRGSEAFSREEARKIFRQADQTLYAQVSGSSMKETLRNELRSRLHDHEMQDEECVASASTVKSCIDDAYEFITSYYHSIEASVPVQRGFTAKFTGVYKAELKAINTPDAKKVLNLLVDSFYKRKLVLKKMRKQTRNVILEEIAAEMKAQLKDGISAATKGLVTSNRGGMSKEVRKHTKNSQKEITAFAQERSDALRSLMAEEDPEDGTINDAIEEEGVDIDAYDLHDAERNPRGEPLFWSEYGDDETIKVYRKSDELSKENEAQAGTMSSSARIDFLKKFVAHTNRQSSGLTCRLCVADPIASQKAKEKQWVLNRLKLHYKGTAHSRRAQLASAFNAIKDAYGTGDAPCPHCPSRLYKSSSSWLEHVAKVHTFELWLGEEDEDENGEGEDEDAEVRDDADEEMVGEVSGMHYDSASSFQGFGDGEALGDDEFEGFSS